MCKMIEVQCVVLGADSVFLEPSKLLLEFAVFGCCNLGGSQGEVSCAGDQCNERGFI